MADFYSEIASYLDDEGVGTYESETGRNIFRNRLPATPDDALAIFAIPGSQVPIGSRDVSTLQFPRFQIIVRSVSYDDGADMLAAVRTALHAKNDITLPNWRVLKCMADQEGGPIGHDDQNRNEFAINFSAEINAETA